MNIFRVDNINLRKTWDFFINNLNWKKVWGRWALVVLTFFIFTLGSYLLMFLPVVLMEDSSSDTLRLLYGVVMFLGYLLIFGFILGVYSYALGRGLTNYKKMRGVAKEPYRVIKTSFSIDRVFGYIIEGVKLLIVNFVYSLPFLIFAALWFGTFILFFNTLINEQITNSVEGGLLFLLVYLVFIFLFIFIEFVYIFFQSAVLKPIIWERIYQKGFVKSLNPFKTLQQFNSNKKRYLLNGLKLAVLYLIWFGAYMISGVLVYLCIGIFFIPFAYAFIYLIIIYLHPHMMWQAMKNN
jgi:ABC-type transport system involved in multi-copper enzyme maturation permease subunit